MPLCMQHPLLSPTELAMSATELAMSAMGSEATPLSTLPLPPLPCTPRLPRQLPWLFTTITHQQLLPMPLLLLPMLLLLLPPRPTTMSPSHTPPRPSPMGLDAAVTVRFTPTRSFPTATSTPSPTLKQTTTSTPLSPTTGLGCEVDLTPSPCRTRGSSTLSTPLTRTATSPPSPTRAPPSSPTSSELWIT